jgi:hypothetical protein
MKSFSKPGASLLVAAALVLPSAALAEPTDGASHDRASNAEHGSNHDKAAAKTHDHKKKKIQQSVVKKQESSTHVKDSPN